MALNFPSNPTTNQTYQSGSSATYRYNGAFWTVVEPSPLEIVFASSASFATTASFSQTASFVNSLSQSVLISGSLNVLNNELGVTSAGVNMGTALTDRHTITGSLSITGSVNITGSLTASSALIASGSIASASFASTASFVIGSSWVDGGVIIIGGSTTGPIKAGIKDFDYIRYRKVADKEWEIDMRYLQTTTQPGTTAGNGYYLFQLPAGLQFNPSFQPFSNDVTSPFLGFGPAIGIANANINGASGIVSNGTSYASLTARAFNATRFLLVTNTIYAGSVATNNPISQAIFPIDGNPLLYSMRFTFTATT